MGSRLTTFVTAAIFIVAIHLAARKWPAIWPASVVRKLDSSEVFAFVFYLGFAIVVVALRFAWEMYQHARSRELISREKAAKN